MAGQAQHVRRAADRVEVDGEQCSQHLAYVLLHKPAGVLTTANDPQGRPTVVDLVRHDSRVVAVGRLDADTTGVLLLTNDGELAHRLAHPKYEVEKVYEAVVEGEPGDDVLRRLAEGVELEDGQTAPARVRPRPVAGRARDPRGTQPAGPEDARGGRPPRPPPAPEPLRGADHRGPATRRLARAHRRRGDRVTLGPMIVDSAVYENGHRYAGDIPLEETYERAASRLLRLDRPPRAVRGRVRRRPAGVRPPRARRRGRHQGAPAAEARGLRRDPLHRPQDGRVRGRSRSVRRDPPRSPGKDSSSPCATATSPCTRSAPRWSNGRTCSLTAP